MNGLEPRRNPTELRVTPIRLTVLGCSEAVTRLSSALQSYRGLDTYRNVFVDCDKEILLAVIRQVSQSIAFLVREQLKPASDSAQPVRDSAQPARDSALGHFKPAIFNYNILEHIRGICFLK